MLNSTMIHDAARTIATSDIYSDIESVTYRNGITLRFGEFVAMERHFESVDLVYGSFCVRIPIITEYIATYSDDSTQKFDSADDMRRYNANNYGIHMIRVKLIKSRIPAIEFTIMAAWIDHMARSGSLY